MFYFEYKKRKNFPLIAQYIVEIIEIGMMLDIGSKFKIGPTKLSSSQKFVNKSFGLIQVVDRKKDLRVNIKSDWISIGYRMFIYDYIVYHYHTI